jgi:hypothetical protein
MTTCLKILRPKVKICLSLTKGKNFFRFKIRIYLHLQVKIISLFWP